MTHSWHVRAHRLITEYEPFDAIRKGDIILWNGRPRTVREVTRSQEDAVRCLTFAILRKSWTNRPYTIYTRTEIRKAFGGVIARRKDADTLCATDHECAVQREIAETDPHRRHITANVMVGTVW